MRLLDVYSHPQAEDILWRLLQERTPEESISHKKMPALWQHAEFMRSKPYHVWYLIDVGKYIRGSIYLSKQREIGVFIFKDQRGNRYGLDAVMLLMQTHPGRFLANVAPTNPKSAALFEGLGFRHIQNTFALET